MAESVLISPGISMVETDMSAVSARPLVAGAAIVGPTVKGPVLAPTKVTSYSEYARVFGTTFETDWYSGSTGTKVNQEFLTSIAAKNYFEQGGDSLLVTRVAALNEFTAAESTLIKSSGSVATASFKIYTLGEGAIFNNVSGSTYDSASMENSDGSLKSGSADNIRFQISAINEDAGTFSLTVRRGDDNSASPVILENFNNLSLDPYSTNYIAAVIGDQHPVCSETGDGDVYVKYEGNYINKSNFIRVEVLRPTPNYLDNTGSPVAAYKAYLPEAQRGAFQGATGIVGKPAGESGSFISSSSVVYFENILEASTYPQSVATGSYDKAFALLENTDEYKVNIISAPGLINKDAVKSLAEKRGDCIAVVDLVEFNKSASQAAEKGAAQNSSYAAAYWPWVQMYSATGRLVWCPASTVIPGVYTYNDKQAAPWFAPAGMTRGGISGVVQTELKLTKSMRDKVYEKNINPIATMPGSGVVVYGQKTLQKKASALDRVNVRRLLIEVKEKVKNMAEGLLFEQNTVALQNDFKGQLDPYLSSIVQKRGLYAYKIDLSGNTNDAIDRNEFHCTILLQPTRSIEFIYLNFTVTATGVEFE